MLVGMGPWHYLVFVKRVVELILLFAAISLSFAQWMLLHKRGDDRHLDLLSGCVDIKAYIWLLLEGITPGLVPELVEQRPVNVLASCDLEHCCEVLLRLGPWDLLVEVLHLHINKSLAILVSKKNFVLDTSEDEEDLNDHKIDKVDPSDTLQDIKVSRVLCHDLELHPVS